MTQCPPDGGDDNALPANGLAAVPLRPAGVLYPRASVFYIEFRIMLSTIIDPAHSGYLLLHHST